MALGAGIVRIGSSRFTAGQFGFLRRGIESGLSRDSLRQVFRNQYNEGFSNATFATARRFVQDSRRAGDMLNTLQADLQLNPMDIPVIDGDSVVDGFSYSGSVAVEGGRRGMGAGRLAISFQDERLLTPEQIRQRAIEIVDKANDTSESGLKTGDVRITDTYQILADPELTLE